MHLVNNREEYLRLRNSGDQIANVSEARNGNSEAKRKLVQMNYSCLPAEGGFLKGATRQSNSVGMDIDLRPTPNPSLGRGEEVKPTPNPSLGRGEEAALVERILSLKDELGLLMLERSATKGFHMVFRRRTEMSQEENLEWASRLVGVDYDKGAKDITRVFFTTTASPEDLLYLNDDLFTGGEPVAAVAAAAVAAALTFTACTARAANTPDPRDLYPLTATVYSVSGPTVTVETACGDLFAFYADAPADYQPGALLTLQMDSCGTRGDVADDRILSVTFAGF